MKNSQFKLNDFQIDTISKKEQKTIKGGSYNDTEENDPKKVGGNGNT